MKFDVQRPQNIVRQKYLEAVRTGDEKRPHKPRLAVLMTLDQMQQLDRTPLMEAHQPTEGPRHSFAPGSMSMSMAATFRPR